jgi:GNAT superfamily N-acetyltransferase
VSVTSGEPGTVTVERVVGAAIAEHLPALARLRIGVFREWPYLYEGSLAYEERYLATYAASPHGVVVLARDGERVVGASTAMPLAQHSDDVVPPLVAAGFAPERVCYFGESVLDPAYRGRGLGHAFFVEREAHARARGFSVTAFCAVERPADHPARPVGYRPLDELWRRHGFAKRDDIRATFAWQDLGEAGETEKPMVFWVKELA